MCKVLWLDNDADMLYPYAEYLKEFDIDITLVAKPDDAIEILADENNDFECLLLDIKIYALNDIPDDENAILNGFDFLDRMLIRKIDIPVCILSSYLHLKEHEERLSDYRKNKNLRGIALDKFIGDTDSDLFKINFVDKLTSFVNEVELKKMKPGIRPIGTLSRFPKNPFQMRYHTYVGLAKSEQRELRRVARSQVEDELQELSHKDGVIWALYIGGASEPHSIATSLNGIASSDEIRALALDRDRIPFQFRVNTRIEDQWGRCGGAPEQASYPKIALQCKGRVAAGDWHVHFDTGSVETYFSLEEFVEIGLFTDMSDMTEDDFSGTPFSFRKENVKFRMLDEQTNETIDVTASVNLVEGWSGSPFLAPCFRSCKSGRRYFAGSVRNCVSRPGLVGRAFLLDGELTAEYNPRSPLLKISKAD